MESPTQLEQFRQRHNIKQEVEQKIGNDYLTELEIKRSALHPSASLSDVQVRQVRATTLGLSLSAYDLRLKELGVKY